MRLSRSANRVRMRFRAGVLGHDEGVLSWVDGGFAMPAPTRVKHSVLERWAIPHAPWLETGTFQGDTTDFLSRYFPFVVTLEPMTVLYERAVARFESRPNVRVVNAASEDGFVEAADGLGDRINF